MIGAGVLLLFLSLALSGQPFPMSTTFDGATVYIATSSPRRGTNEPRQGRVYTITKDGVALFAERGREVLINEPGQPEVTNYFWYTAAEVTGGEETIALTAVRQCLSGRNCIGVPLTETTVSGAAELIVGGRVKFSPNGRWMLKYREDSLGTTQGGLFNLQSGSQYALHIGADQLHAGSPVANEGSLVQTVNGFLRILPSGAFDWMDLTQLMTEEAYTPSISADSRFVVFASKWQYPNHAYTRLRIVDTASRQIRTLVEGFADYYQPVLSHDGRVVLFLSNDPHDLSRGFMAPQAFVVGIQGDSLRRLTNDAYGIAAAILSGDGRVAYAQSKSGRLVRVDVDSGTQTELLPPSIQVFNITSVVAGSRVDVEAFDDPALKILIDGRPVGVSREGVGRFSFVMPFETAGRTVRLTAESNLPVGPFEPQLLDQEAEVAVRLPRAYDLPPEYGGPGAYGMRFSRVCDEPCSRVITPYDPALPGEMVNVMASGLGPVDSTTGDLKEPLSCRWFEPSGSVDIPSVHAGLHPTEPGVYQVRLRLPEKLPFPMTYEGALQVACEFPGESSGELVMLIPVRR